MTPNQPVTGAIIGVRDCKTVVVIFLATDDERTVPLVLEWRAFRWLLEGEDCRPDELVGRRISYDGNRILFLDEERTR
jgi:hypothetical protein